MFAGLGAALGEYSDTYTDDEIRLRVRFASDVDAIVPRAKKRVECG